MHYPAISKIVEDEALKRGLQYAKYDTLPQIIVRYDIVLTAALFPWSWARGLWDGVFHLYPRSIHMDFKALSLAAPQRTSET